MDNGEEHRQEEWGQEHRDRLFDLLKHVSTLNVAALVLTLALLRDFDPPVYAPEAPLLFFGGSLLLSMLGLAAAPWGRPPGALVTLAITLAYLAFFGGVLLTILNGIAAL